METLKKIISTLPHAPGVYLYKDGNGKIIYIGKAKDLYRRVHQYFQHTDDIDSKTRILVENIRDIQIIQTVCEFDALLLEAQLIHTHTPKYNIILKDDKSPLYILLAFSEQMPHVYMVRRNELSNMKQIGDIEFGPFQSAKTVRTLMRQLRHVVPYCTQKKRNGKPCFYTHIGLCAPCPSAILSVGNVPDNNDQIRTYRNNIYRLRDILSGKSSSVLSFMESEMQRLAEEEQFEKAAETKNHIEQLRSMLQKRYDPSVYSETYDSFTPLVQKELDYLGLVLRPYIPALQSLHRIECIDISNIGGIWATGSLVVLIDGKIDTSLYKRFKIRVSGQANDFAMIEEVTLRRFSHPDWLFPDLFIVDGGKGQVQAALQALKTKNLHIPVVGLAKRYEEIVLPVNKSFKILRVSPENPALHIVERIRDEAHRFALSYHKLLRKKALNLNK
jgi:excinuclease ABC subunit C